MCTIFQVFYRCDTIYHTYQKGKFSLLHSTLFPCNILEILDKLYSCRCLYSQIFTVKTKFILPGGQKLKVPHAPEKGRVQECLKLFNFTMKWHRKGFLGGSTEMFKVYLKSASFTGYLESRIFGKMSWIFLFVASWKTCNFCQYGHFCHSEAKNRGVHYSIPIL